jgi:hypothetical protein
VFSRNSRLFPKKKRRLWKSLLPMADGEAGDFYSDLERDDASRPDPAVGPAAVRAFDAPLTGDRSRRSLSDGNRV